MTEILKRCPFCGSTANIAKGQIEFWAYCPHCGVQTELYETEKEVAKAWNSRPIENELHKKIEKLEAENTRLREALEFYANTDVYEYYDKYESTAIQNEGGQKAREALKELLK